MENYRLGKKIGEGGFGTVYKGTVTKTGEECAIKIINIKKYREEKRAGFFTEVAILSKIKKGCHPFLLCFIDSFIDVHNFDGQLVIITEFFKGKDLREMLDTVSAQEHLQNLKGLEDICVYINNGIAYLHSLGVAHRDLKLENILCSASSNDVSLKIIDFGFACDNEKDSSCQLHLSEWKERDGIFHTGTLDYVPPEYYLKDNIGVKEHSLEFYMKHDVFSFGVLCFEMIGNQVSNNISTLGDLNDPESSLHKAFYNNELTFPTGVHLKEIPESTSSRIRNLIISCLQPDPSKRPMLTPMTI